MAEATEEELNCYLSCLVVKTSTIRCHVGVFKRKICFLQNNYESLLKPHIELVALVILRVPPILTVALLKFFI